MEYIELVSYQWSINFCHILELTREKTKLQFSILGDDLCHKLNSSLSTLPVWMQSSLCTLYQIPCCGNSYSAISIILLCFFFVIVCKHVTLIHMESGLKINLNNPLTFRLIKFSSRKQV